MHQVDGGLGDARLPQPLVHRRRFPPGADDPHIGEGAPEGLFLHLEVPDMAAGHDDHKVLVGDGQIVADAGKVPADHLLRRGEQPGVGQLRPVIEHHRRKPMVVSRGHRAWEICPAPNSRARWPMGRGREMYPAAMEKPGVRRAWAVSSGRLPETTLSRSSSAGAEPSSASTSQPAVPAVQQGQGRLAVSLHRGSSAGIN